METQREKAAVPEATELLLDELELKSGLLTTAWSIAFCLHCPTEVCMWSSGADNLAKMPDLAFISAFAQCCTFFASP